MKEEKYIKKQWFGLPTYFDISMIFYDIDDLR